MTLGHVSAVKLNGGLGWVLSLDYPQSSRCKIHIQSPEVNLKGSKPGNSPYFLFVHKVVWVHDTQDQRLVYFFCEGLESNCFRLFGSHGLCHGPLAVPLWGEGGPRYCAEEWAGLCSRRTLFMKLGSQTSPQAAPDLESCAHSGSA